MKSIENFVSLEVVEATVNGIAPAGSDDQQAVKLFRKALDRRRKGLPDQEPVTRDDDDDE